MKATGNAAPISIKSMLPLNPKSQLLSQIFSLLSLFLCDAKES
jgi:hypothetical protein